MTSRSMTRTPITRQARKRGGGFSHYFSYGPLAHFLGPWPPGPKLSQKFSFEGVKKRTAHFQWQEGFGALRGVFFFGAGDRNRRADWTWPQNSLGESQNETAHPPFSFEVSQLFFFLTPLQWESRFFAKTCQIMTKCLKSWPMSNLGQHSTKSGLD